MFSATAERQHAWHKRPSALKGPRHGATPVAPDLRHDIAQSSFAHASTSTDQYTPTYAVDVSAPLFGIRPTMQSGCHLAV